MDETTAKAERTRLFYLGVLSYGLLSFMGLLLTSCQPKKASAAPPTTIIYADTTRVKLVHRADQSSDSLTILHQHNQQTLATYEKDVVHYDSIQLALP